MNRIQADAPLSLNRIQAAALLLLEKKYFNKGASLR
jgi:hypothetical protein